MELRDPSIRFFTMIFTLILFSSALSLIHYIGLQEYLVIFLSLPLEYYVGTTAILIMGRVALAIYRLIPVYRNFVRSIDRVANSSSNLVKRLGVKSNNSQTRLFSTNAKPRKKLESVVKANQAGDLNNNKSTTPLSILSLLRNKYVVKDVMIPLTEKIGTTLRLPFAFNNMLAHGRVGRLAGGMKRTLNFLNFVLKYYRSHGVGFTIKWLKASHVAISKCLGQNKLLSLRTLVEDLPLPRLLNGLPSVIPFEDRMRIRRGDVNTIRFWLGLFNLYRVLQAPGQLKLNTITDPWTGQFRPFISLCQQAKRFNPFAYLEGYREIELEALAPKTFIKSRSASPSNSVSMFGIFTDVRLLMEHNPKLWSVLNRYLDLVQANTFQDLLTDIVEVNRVFYEYEGWRNAKTSELFVSEVEERPFIQVDVMMTKPAIRMHGLPAGDGLSQFAIKEEAAGKIRIFALVDNITQSILRPLHDYLFSILRIIPNDGTFNQEAAIQRAQTKAIKSGKAFSYDLSAATDRVPVLLTSLLFGQMLGSFEFGRLWKEIMISRPFGFLEPTAKKLNVDPKLEYYYRVGQPMGALSSWAGLAITHHWIVQVAARDTYHSVEWFEGYEILGDDIVIFDELVAQRYLAIMTEIGCEININKSIISPKRPVFEFAKRICWGDKVVSGISLNQVRSMVSVGSRLASALQFAQAGLLSKSSSLVSAVLSRDAFSNGQALRPIQTMSVRDQKARSLGLLALLGQRYQAGILSLKEVVRLVLDPTWGKASGRNAVAIPIQFATQLAYRALIKLDVAGFVPPQAERRDQIYEYLEASIRESVLERCQAAIDRLKDTNNIVGSIMFGETAEGEEYGYLAKYFELWNYNVDNQWEKLLFTNNASGLALANAKVKRLGNEYHTRLSDTPDGLLLEWCVKEPLTPVPVWDLPEDLQDKVNLAMSVIDRVWLNVVDKVTELDSAIWHARENGGTLDEALDLLDEITNAVQEFKDPEVVRVKPGTTVIEVESALSSIRDAAEELARTTGIINDTIDTSGLTAEELRELERIPDASTLFSGQW